VYRRGKGTDQAIYRAESYDYGATWRADPAPDTPFKRGPNGLAHAVEVWNDRTAQRLLLYNDQSDVDSTGKATGRGNILADIYGPDQDPNTGLLKLVSGGPFHVTPAGTLSDNGSFGAIYIGTIGALDCVITVGGARRVFRSFDDGKSWRSDQG
jgi:hypothetical protein